MDDPLAGLQDPLPVAPLTRPPDLVATVPGGRSVTNRALVAAALAPGRSTIIGAGLSDDSEAMVSCLTALGAGISISEDQGSVVVQVDGVDGHPHAPASVFTRLSGTTSRFVTPVAALAGGPVLVDAAAPMRTRPMADLIGALRGLGVTVVERGEPGHLPVEVTGPPVGSEVEVAGDVSSQFLSGLLLAGGALEAGLTVRCSTSRLVSGPYVQMTRTVMAAFGVPVAEHDGAFIVPGGGYRPCRHLVEPDAASAAYLFTAATLSGGRVRVDGLPPATLQADAAFVDVLAAMGAEVRRESGHTEVRGPRPGADGRVHLRGGRFDLTEMSDMAPTLAVAAAFADEPVEVVGIGFVRGKESDRIAASVAELRRCGVRASETEDGFVVSPGGDGPHGAQIRTYDDHRMAMSFALIGLMVEGISISDPGCVAKTFPGYWQVLRGLAASGEHGGKVSDP